MPVISPTIRGTLRGTIYGTLAGAFGASTLALSLAMTSATIGSDGAPDANDGLGKFNPELVWTNPGDHRMQYDRNGALQYAPHNLLTYSTFDAALPTNWTSPVNTGSRSLVTMLNGETGIEFVASSQRPMIQQTPAIQVGEVYKFRFYVENTSGMADSEVVGRVSGAYGGGTVEATIGDIDADGYVEIISGVAISTTTIECRIGLGATANQTGTIRCGLPSVQKNPAPDTYIATTTSAVYGARAGTDNRKPVTNLLSYPENLDTGVYWSEGGNSFSSGQADPFGGTRAFKMVETSGSGARYFSKTGIDLEAKTYTWTVFAKADEREWLAINAYIGTDRYTWFNLSTAEIGTNASGNTAFIIPIPGTDYYRCTVTRTIASAVSGGIGVNMSNADNTATYTGDGSSGLFVSHPMLNEGGIEDYVGSHNLILDDDPDGDTVFSGWSATRATIGDNSTTAPDGTTTADTFGDDSSTGSNFVQLTKNITLPEAGTYRFYILAKQKQLTWLAIQQTGWDQGLQRSYYDLANGVMGATNDSDGTITYWNNDWQLCTLDVTTSSDLSGSINLLLANGNGDITVDLDGTSDIYIWGAELKRVQANSSFDYPPCCLPATGYVKRGYLSEATATNLLPYSNDFSQWDIQNTDSLTVTAAQAIGPDGLLSLSKIEITDTTNEGHSISDTLTISASTNYCVHGVLKGGAVRYVELRGFFASNDWAAIAVDTYAGTITEEQEGSGTASVVDYGLRPLGDGDYFVWFVCQDTANTSFTPAIGPLTSGTPTRSTTGGGEVFAGTAGDEFYAGFMMVEQGDFPSSHIVTAGGTETRTADPETLETVLDWFNAEKGTIIHEATPAGDPTSTDIVSIDDNTANEVIKLAVDGSDNIDFDIIDGGVSQDSIDSGVNAINGVRFKAAASYLVNDNAISVDGNTAVSGGGTSTLPTVTRLKLKNGYWHRSLQFHDINRDDTTIAADATRTDAGTSWKSERQAA